MTVKASCAHMPSQFTFILIMLVRSKILSSQDAFSVVIQRMKHFVNMRTHGVGFIICNQIALVKLGGTFMECV